MNLTSTCIAGPGPTFAARRRYAETVSAKKFSQLWNNKLTNITVSSRVSAAIGTRQSLAENRRWRIIERGGESRVLNREVNWGRVNREDLNSICGVYSCLAIHSTLGYPPPSTNVGG